MNMNALDQLRQYSTIVADTANYQTLAQFAACDATTNPSLILKATQSADYQIWREKILSTHKGKSTSEKMDALLVAFGVEILSHLKGRADPAGGKDLPARVSTEIDARLSFNTAATVAKAHHLIALYQQAGVSRAQVLIKIASTWEGIQAARILQSEGIACNLTLLFSSTQARACAEAGVQLISPFVGRVSDWALAKQQLTSAQLGDATTDPGIHLVSTIYQDYKARGVTTEIMAASFRNTDQVLALSGCDLLTISPSLLAELQASTVAVVCRLTPLASAREGTGAEYRESLLMSEPEFRFALNQNEMAHDKLAQGIRLFVEAAVALEKILA